MKKPFVISPLVICLGCLALIQTALGDLVTGRILCDANQNRVIDAGDVGIAGAMVVIRSEAGGFSNATVTAANGSFSLTIPNFDASAYRRDPLSQSYIESISPGTLPADATVIVPQPALGTNPVYYIAPATTNSPLTFISLAGQFTNGDWLIASSACLGVEQSNSCRVSGSGAIQFSQHRVEHSFSGSISSRTNRHGFRQGNWTHDARALKLRFKSTEIDNVSCGETSNASSTFNTIQFSGRGIVRDYNRKRSVVTPVLFSAAVEDHGKKNDLYYIRVYDTTGATLILVSGDTANPEDIVPIPITRGNLRVIPAH